MHLRQPAAAATTATATAEAVAVHPPCSAPASTVHAATRAHCFAWSLRCPLLRPLRLLLRTRCCLRLGCCLRVAGHGTRLRCLQANAKGSRM